MGGCRSKPRVVKEPDQQYYDQHNTTAPEAVVGHNNNNSNEEAISESDHHQPQADHEDEVGGQVSVLHEIIHVVDLDKQSNKRPSLSSFFHQSEDEKAKTVSENNEGEEKLKEEEASEREEKGSNNEGMKQESQVREAKHKWSEETENSNKAAEKCEGNRIEKQMQAEA
ncbi:hypothetical protein QN277_025937 [Acacia crassicarpa]|uniref:Uncharacterized protein n=1 Tax=Acacia crassicarpa TaxID=499986 RepID=A0AAE1JAY9_9FABA|nr:hypothetical protein QN277_025937 [Acacia crassicarpa]